MTFQQIKPWLTVVGGAFATGAMGFVSTHLSGAIPTTMQASEAFLGGVALGGLVGVFHLYQPAPNSPAAVVETIAINAVEKEAAKITKGSGS
jgi:hypothetical protein